MLPSGFQVINGIGLIPLNWDYSTADQLCSKITKGTTPKKTDITKNQRIPFLRVNNLSFDGVLKPNSEMIFVNEDTHNGFLSRSIAYPNDILMNIVGPPLGKISLLDDSFPEYNMNQAIVIYRIVKSNFSHLFFLAYLKSSIAQQWLQSRSKKTSGQQNLTIQLCKELPVPVPPLPEQRKIAQILSTWDKAISATESLIANSQQQKKSLMQQLLTGKKRFAEFEGGWKLIPIGSVCTSFSGGTPSRSKPQYYGGAIPWIKSGEVNNRFIYSVSEHITEEGLHNSSAKLVKKDNILVAMYGATAGKVAINMIDNAAINQAILALIPHDGCSNIFMFYLLEKEMNRALNLVQGGQPNFNASIIKNIKINLPSLQEQKKIASVLTSTDQEINTLQQKLYP